MNTPERRDAFMAGALARGCQEPRSSVEDFLQRLRAVDDDERQVRGEMFLMGWDRVDAESRLSPGLTSSARIGVHWRS